MSRVLLKIFPSTAALLIAANFFRAKLIALPTAKRKEGNTRSVGVQPFQWAWRNGEYVKVSLPGVFTMIIKQTVIPLKISRDRLLEEDGSAGAAGD